MRTLNKFLHVRCMQSGQEKKWIRVYHGREEKVKSSG